MDNIVIVSGAQQSDSAIHIHVSILPQTPLPSRLPHNIEQSSPRSTVVFFGSHNAASLPQGSCFLAGRSRGRIVQVREQCG